MIILTANDITVTLSNEEATFLRHCLGQYQTLLEENTFSSSMYFESPEVDAANIAKLVERFYSPTDFLEGEATPQFANQPISQETYSSYREFPTEFQYLIDFAKTSDFKLAKNRLRLSSLWTAFCIKAYFTTSNIDETMYDTLLKILYDNIPLSAKEYDTKNNTPSFQSYCLFKMFMSDEI